MEWHFAIPSQNSELLSSDRNNYCVARVLDAPEVPDALKASRQGLNEPFGIFNHFDTFFSVIDNAPQLAANHLLRAFDQLYTATDRLGSLLADIFSRPELNKVDRMNALNAVKMHAFLINGVVKAIDAHITLANENVVKKGRKVVNEETESLDWDNKRYKCLVQLYNLIQLPLEKLWDPPICEESFVDVVCDVCYRTLELPYARSKTTSDSVFQILGTAIKRYNHALGFPVRTMQIMGHVEASISPIAAGVLLLHEEFSISTIYTVMIKEIIERLSLDAADAHTSRLYSQFLLELGMSEPKNMIPHLSTLSEELLSLDSYTLRNCVLQLMGEVIIAELSSEELSDELREIRDEFLEDLLGHMMDVSAHVRSKVLQVWFHIKEQNAVPLAWLHRVLQVAVERLEDKALLVRKHAICLIKAFLEHNPYSAKLSLAELRKQYEEEDQKLQELRNKMVERDSQLKKIEEDWEDATVQMYPMLSELSSKQLIESIVGTEDDVKRLTSDISQLVSDQKYEELILLAQKADYALGNHNERKEFNNEQLCMYFLTLLKNYYISCRMGPDMTEEFQKIENSVNFLRDSINFSVQISNAVPKLRDMLMSRSQTDVYEAIDFFTSAYLFGIKGTECGLQQMLFLVWSTDKDKRENVTAAYKRVLLVTDLQGRAHTVKAVKNLSQFLSNVNHGHYAAMEVLVKEWIANGDIDAQMIQVMFEIYTMKLEDVSSNDALLALQLLIMVSAAKPSVVTANMALLEQIGFEGRGRKDPRIFVGTLALLINSIQASTNSSKYYKRHEHNSPIVMKVIEVFLKLFFKRHLENFDIVITKVLDFVYAMVKSPDIVSQDIVLAIYKRLHDYSSDDTDARLTQFSQATTYSQIASDKQEHVVRLLPNQKLEPMTLPVLLLNRFVFTVGYITMREMIYLDIDVYSNLKYRQELKEELKHQKKKSAAIAKSNNAAKRKTVTLDVSASNAMKRLSGTAGQEPVEPEEEVLSGATAEDTVAEHINFICESEMLYTNTISNKIIPMLVEICMHPNRYRDEMLQKASVMTLIRLMTVSSRFCEDNMPFLMNIFQHTKHNGSKRNIIIGLSDFTFRFPNVIEPWTSHLYATLYENDVSLRLTAVKMLSHLVLHEMIRVKGQISDLAMCIVDPEPQIRTITEQFFKEIANKSNILYNVLPDIISRLSDVSLKLEEEKYHVIMRYIIGLINKDKQIESLVEKLCIRFRMTSETRQWRDIAFCLSLLSYNEKTIKKLIEHVGMFKDKVQYEEIYASFKTIISNTNKLAKPELKAMVSEFELRLEECLAIREDGDLGRMNDESSTGHVSLRKVVPRGSKPSAKSGAKSTAGRGRGRGRGRTPHAKRVSSDSESGSEEENLPPAASSRAAARARQNHKITKVIETDISEVEFNTPMRKKRDMLAVN